MSRFAAVIRKPVFILAFVLPIVMVAEFILLEGMVGISFPTDRGSAMSAYEIREKGTELHFITRNKRFSIVDLWSKHGSAREELVLREFVVTDRRDGIEGDRSTVKLEAVSGDSTKWTIEEPGERGRVIDQAYEVTKLGCCDAPNKYTYYSLRDGKKLLSRQSELNSDELAALLKPLYD